MPKEKVDGDTRLRHELPMTALLPRYGAADVIRTHNLPLTRRLLCQLS